MNFLSKFNFNYHSKILNAFLQNKNYSEFISHLLSLSNSKKETFARLVQKFHPFFYENALIQDRLPKKIIWLISFNNSDTLYLSKFLNAYLQFKNIDFDGFQSYPNRIAKFNDLHNQNEYSLDDQLNRHCFYQTLINNLTPSDYALTGSCSAFYETQDKKYFTYPYTSAFYVYFIRNPLSLYSDLKQKHKDKTAGISELFNYEKATHLESINGLNIEENKQGWAVHVNSWVNENVKNTLRGLILKEEDLMENPLETLSEIIIHFNQHTDSTIDLDYQFISNYLDQNPILFAPLDEIQISNQELKMIDREVGALKNILHYKF